MLTKAEALGLPLTTGQVSPSPFLQREILVQPKGNGAFRKQLQGT